MFQKHSRLFYRTLLICLLLSIGCSKDNTVPISGKITAEDGPVDTGTISFVPMDGATQEAGAMIRDGVYTAAVPPGEKIVKIRADKLVDIEGYDEVSKTTTTGQAGMTISPPEYNTENSPLRAKVTKGGETFDFKLPARKASQ